MTKRKAAIWALAIIFAIASIIASDHRWCLAAMFYLFALGMFLEQRLAKPVSPSE